MAFTLLTNLRCIILVFLIIAACVGVSGRQIQNKNDVEIYVSFWEFKDATGTVTKAYDLGCDALRNRLRAGAALTIIAIIFYFFMLIMAMADLVDGPRKVANYIYTFLNLVSFVFILVSWGLVAAIYHQESCANYVPKNNGYEYAYGFALLVSVWCAQILAEVLRLIADRSYDAADYENDPYKQEMEDKEKERKRREEKKRRHAARRESTNAAKTGNAPDEAS